LITFYNNNDNIPSTTPEDNLRVTFINTGVADSLQPIEASFPSTWGNITCSTPFNGFTYVGTDNGTVYYSSDGEDWFQITDSFNNAVRCMVVYQSNLIIGGDFNSTVTSGMSCNFIVRMNTSNVLSKILFTNLGGSNGFDLSVQTLWASVSGYLMIGGDFTRDNSTTLSCPYIAIMDNLDNLYCLDNTSGSGYGFNGPVTIIREDTSNNNYFLIFGNFNTLIYNGGSFSCSYNVVLNMTTYNVTGTPQEISPLDGIVTCSNQNGSSIYIGGNFTGHLLTTEWNSTNSIYDIIANPYTATPPSPLTSISNVGGIWWGDNTGALYEANNLVATSPFGVISIIYGTVWGQTLFSTNSTGQTPTISYYFFTSNVITLTITGGYSIINGTTPYTGGIILGNVGAVCEMIYFGGTFWVVIANNTTFF
jgi:hypothetical protein